MKTHKEQDINWKRLKKGDLIKIIAGTGPYIVIIKNGIEERVSMGYSGKFRVVSLDKYGIHAYPVKANESGHCFIYMGKKCKSKHNTIMNPHKIKLLTKKG